MRFKRLRSSFLERPIERIYNKIPQLPLPIKYGRIYWQKKVSLNQSQWYSEEQIKQLQVRELSKLLLHAGKNVPYYRELFKTIRFDPRDFNSLTDMQELPLLTKEIIRERKKDLVSEKHKNKLKYVSTSGTTGTPLGLYWEKGYTTNIEKAFYWHVWNWINLKPYDRVLVLRGIVLSDEKIYKYLRNNKLSISIYHINEKYLPILQREINRFRPEVIQAIPSALYILTKLLKRSNYKFPSKVKTILTSSENLYDYQESLFCSYFNCPVSDIYGNTERTVLINRCEKNNYHILPEYAFTELINNNNTWCNSIGEAGHIISTPFHNYAMPLIRHKTGDLAEYSNLHCSCNRNYPVVKNIIGREQDFIIKCDNSIIDIGAVTGSIHNRLLEKIEKFQFYQDKVGAVDFNIVKNADLTDAELTKIYDEIKRKIGSNCSVKINFVESIHLTDRGKSKVLIQKLNFSLNEYYSETFH